MSVVRSSVEGSEKVGALINDTLLKLNEIMVDDMIRFLGRDGVTDRVLYGKNMFSMCMNFCSNLMLVAIKMDADISNQSVQKTEKT